MIKVYYTACSDTLTEALQNCIDLHSVTGMNPTSIETVNEKLSFHLPDARKVISGEISETKYIEQNKL